jgi:hypothetical protein
MGKQTHWDSEPIINKVMNGQVDKATLECFSAELQALHRAAHKSRPIAFHKAQLGRQNYTWVGEYRFWVWETDTWRVYVSDQQGTSLEVKDSLSPEQSLAAWNDYLFKMGLKKESE